MYRVVLVDDEKLIVEGLRKVVKWEDYRCEVVATASDAQSGAAAIRQYQPHILFTDIRMPGDDGLTMLAGLRSEYPDMQELREHSGSFLVRQATAYIESHYAEKLTLQDVADACYVSQWHLSKLLNRHTDGNFYDVLNTVRINAAKRLLRDPSLKIGEIGERVGYADTAHFARVFKKLVGMSANEYRNSHI